MAQYELLLPKMGESIAEATIIKWLKQVGDAIQSDESVLEIATDKVDSEVPSPVVGKLVKQLFRENDIVQVGDVIALIEIDLELSKSEEKSFEKDSTVVASTQNQQINSFSSQDKNEVHAVRFYSPLVRNIAAGAGISLSDLMQIAGTGLGGRVTKQDILDFLDQVSSKSTIKIESDTILPSVASSEQAIEAEVDIALEIPTSKVVVNTFFSGTDEVIEMDRMRRLIADHMVLSKHTSPHVTSFVEADVTNMVRWRERLKAAFEKREGEKITFTPLFIEALSKAIKDFPMINVMVNGTQIIKRKSINIGMATALPSGNLIVPVIKDADQLNLLGLSKMVNDLAHRARQSKLRPDETQGGTFTFTNIGSFGNLMGTPIIYQPQVAILAVGAITKKPAVLETIYGDVIAVRHKLFLSLSYDHRVVDGSLGGSFVKKVADYLEAWDVNREI